MHKRIIILVSSTLAACAATLALLWLVGVGAPAQAAPALSHSLWLGDHVRLRAVQVASQSGAEGHAAELQVCPSGCTYSSVQAAVDAADPGDVIKVAQGTYTDVHVRQGITQVVYLSKAITIRGGYTTAFTDPPAPEANPTTLDAQGQGRVLYITGDIAPTVEGLRITGGDAKGLGGGLEANDDGGGGVYVNFATAVLSGNLVYSNTAYRGGGLWLNYSDARLNADTIISNVARWAGGGLWLHHSDATLSGNTVNSNTAPYAGGGVLHYSDATLSGNTISSNAADDEGGGLALLNSRATLTGNIVAANTVSYKGGGLYLDSSDAALSDNTISGNVATNDRGGGLYLRSSAATLRGNVIHNNAATANQAGGVYLSSSPAILIGNTIYSNTAASDGGGLRLFWSDATLSGNTISHNSATWWGGGLALYFSDATLSGNIITGNTAFEGGGLHLEGESPTLVNNVVADNVINQVTGGGTGIYVLRSFPRLLHTTVARNAGGDGVGVYVTGFRWNGNYEPSVVVMTNTILVNHSVGITVTAENTATLNATLWHANATPWSGNVIRTNDHSGAPAFAADGYHLTGASAAIDKGVDAGVTTDVDGDSRPQGDNCDLGADEYARWFIYLPLVVRNH
jgi:fibronectin-binding autotransporter adhesin